MLPRLFTRKVNPAVYLFSKYSIINIIGRFILFIILLLSANNNHNYYRLYYMFHKVTIVEHATGPNSEYIMISFECQKSEQWDLNVLNLIFTIPFIFINVLFTILLYPFHFLIILGDGFYFNMHFKIVLK